MIFICLNSNSVKSSVSQSLGRFAPSGMLSTAIIILYYAERQHNTTFINHASWICANDPGYYR